MALKKMTPAHKALDALEYLEHEIKKIKAELIATMPETKKKRPPKGKRPFKNPVTGETRYI